jgi:penicillin-binding protein activator
MKSISYLTLLAAIFISGCISTHKVERVSTDEKIDLSGNWNDTDSKLVADEMVNQILQGPWIENYMKASGGKQPVVVVGLIYNKSTEHINSETFIKDIEKTFINSGKVKLVQAGAKREELRSERAGQMEFASAETAKKWGLEIGADIMLNGDISSIVDEYKREKVNYYQVNMELSNVETNEILWIGDKKIKKYIKK